MASAMEHAVRRLEAALQGLEVAVQQRLAASAGAADLASDVEMLSADRANLAEKLDQAQARAVRLEGVNRDVSRRIGTAVDTIRLVLETEAEKS
jgi:hypothetical protein